MASVHRHGRHQDRSGRAAHGRARSLGSLFSDEHRAADVYPDPVFGDCHLVCDRTGTAAFKQNRTRRCETIALKHDAD